MNLSIKNQIRHITQRERYCGPAVVEMLYSFYSDKCVSQDEVAAATGLSLGLIMQRGCTILDLARAVETIDESFVLLTRYNSTIEELDHLINVLKIPVGIEWRCVFQEPDGVLWEEGHYSMVTGSDSSNNILHITDPFNGVNITHTNGLISFDVFRQHWWDENYITLQTDPVRDEHVWTERMMFVLIPKIDAMVYGRLGFLRPTPSFIWANRVHEKRIEYPTRPEEARRIQRPTAI
jgi:hypothetical protein